MKRPGAEAALKRVEVSALPPDMENAGMACYNVDMTRLLDQALEAARNLSPAAQDDIARVVLRLVGTGDEEPPVPLSPDERAAIAASKSAAVRDEFATEEQVRAVWAKHGL